MLQKIIFGCIRLSYGAEIYKQGKGFDVFE